jgi:hypothetical protein
MEQGLLGEELHGHEAFLEKCKSFQAPRTDLHQWLQRYSNRLRGVGGCIAQLPPIKSTKVLHYIDLP